MSHSLVLRTLLVLAVLFLAGATSAGREALVFSLPWLSLGALLVPALRGLRQILDGEPPAPASTAMAPRRPPRARSAEPVLYIPDEDNEASAEPLEPQPICLVCHSDLALRPVFCTRCRPAHHKECFRYAGSCSVFGCGCRTYRLKPRSRYPWATTEEVEFFQ